MKNLWIVVGRNNHQIVDDEEEIVIPNSLEGVEVIINFTPSKIILIGNKRWALPLAHCLKEFGAEIRFLPPPSTTKRGRMGDLKKFARVAFLKKMVKFLEVKVGSLLRIIYEQRMKFGG